MKRLLPFCALLLAPLAFAQSSSSVTFVGAFMERGAIAVRFDETVPRGQKRTMELPDGQVVEMSVDAAGATQVRLLDRTGQELHSSGTPSTEPGTREFMYALCRGGSFAYSSPPQKGKSGCP